MISTKQPPAEASSRRPPSEAEARLQQIVLQPGCKWFCATDRRAEVWSGPFNTIAGAVQSMVAEDYECHAVRGQPIYVGQGRKLTRRECDDLCVDYSWEVDVMRVFEIRLPWLYEKAET